MGATAASKVCYEFKVYDSTSQNVITVVKRLDHDNLSGLLMDINYNPKDPESLIMILKEG